MPNPDIRARVCWGSLTVLAALAIAACSGSDSGSARTAAAPAGLPDMELVPEEQLRYFDDGVVTLEEYQEAFTLFAECARELGGRVSTQAPDPVTGMISYSTSFATQGVGVRSFDQDHNELRPVESPLNDCYQRYFDFAEWWFQTNDPTVLAALPAEQLEMLRQFAGPCLAEHGVDIPDDLEYGSPQYQELGDRFRELSNADACSS